MRGVLVENYMISSVTKNAENVRFSLENEESHSNSASLMYVFS